jgi:chorismate mutase
MAHCNMETPAPAPSLADLRTEIDRIDATMHGLLMERGDIIDRLIKVKRTAESGSAFRPAREAEMMRRLVERHRGILPLDTAESIWRVIIATFTYVQAPFRVHADLSAGDAAMRDSARFHFGFTVPFVTHMGAPGVVAAVAGSYPQPPSPGPAHGGTRLKAKRPRLSRGCPFWSALIIQLGCRCSQSRAHTRTLSSPTWKCGASRSPVGGQGRRRRSPPIRKRSQCRMARSTERRC